MVRELADQVALVTGGSRGIGRTIVERLAEAGMKVVFTFRVNETAAKQVTDTIESKGGCASAIRCDLSQPHAVEELFEAVDQWLAEKGCTGIDILINNAGIAATTPFMKVTEDQYDLMMAVNAKSVFFMMQEAATRLNDGGRIVNVSSVSTTWPSDGVAVYAASKAAVEQFSRVAAREFGSRKITVNTVAPGVTDTDLTRGLLGPEILTEIGFITPLGRIGRPEDIAGAVMLLVGSDAGWITGQHLRADGGLS
jgi:3-oxoacyl-[acyl-carrier protein] reductase